ncbi:hypothetical protein EON63_01135 [archaeon]|nr:MAG: hypothetical protein EON63_01135 [archaeon]
MVNSISSEHHLTLLPDLVVSLVDPEGNTLVKRTPNRNSQKAMKVVVNCTISPSGKRKYTLLGWLWACVCVWVCV